MDMSRKIYRFLGHNQPSFVVFAFAAPRPPLQSPRQAGTSLCMCPSSSELENRICRSPPSHPEYITDRAHSPLLLPLLCSVSQFSCQQRRRRFCLRRYGPVCVLRRTASLERTNERMAASTAELPPHHSLTQAPNPPESLSSATISAVTRLDIRGWANSLETVAHGRWRS